MDFFCYKFFKKKNIFMLYTTHTYIPKGNYSVAYDKNYENNSCTLKKDYNEWFLPILITCKIMKKSLTFFMFSYL